MSCVMWDFCLDPPNRTFFLCSTISLVSFVFLLFLEARLFFFSLAARRFSFIPSIYKCIIVSG